ncbi:MAG: hypothetical protein EX271_06510 [Acidimicrobiales bacterium]|nr:hypothetical protein [Hyphomonadaceae bacterium]RZV42163.1 MAG: hypothetical protein EX271_06510 [Acidimicrobiales bacterium]
MYLESTQLVFGKRTNLEIANTRLVNKYEEALQAEIVQNNDIAEMKNSIEATQTHLKNMQETLRALKKRKSRNKESTDLAWQIQFSEMKLKNWRYLDDGSWVSLQSLKDRAVGKLAQSQVL